MLPAWRVAVRQVLKGAKIRGQAEIAAAIGVEPASVSRYLSGARSHLSSKTVRAINGEVGRLVNDSRVKEYLDTIAAVDGLLPLVDPETDGNELAFRVTLALIKSLNSVAGYLRTGATTEIVAEIWARREPNEAERLSLAIAKVWQKRLLRGIDGSIPKSIAIDELSAECARLGFDLGPWLLPDEDTKEHRYADEFILEVRRALAELSDDVAARNGAEVRISAAYAAEKQTTKTARAHNAGRR